MIVAAQEPAAAPAPARFYRPELDALRFLAFLMVYLHHALPHEAAPYAAAGLPQGLASWLASLATGGAAGVDLFFTLSAFLITTLLLREARATGGLDVRAFYLRRALRIWPLYLAALAFGVGVVPRLLPAEHPGWVHTLAFLAMVGNFACVALGFPHSLIGPLWSISVEEQFYLLWPLTLRRATPRQLAALALGMIALAMAVRAGVAQAGLRYEAIWCNTFARLDPLAAGALLALLLQARPEGLGRARPLAAVLALLLWALVARAADLVPSPRPLGAVLGYLGQALASALAVAAALSPAPSWLGARPLTYLGKISYGLYVFHGPALVGATGLLRHHEGHRRLLTAALGLALTVAAASLSYELFESRFLRYKRRLARVPSGAD